MLSGGDAARNVGFMSTRYRSKQVDRALASPLLFNPLLLSSITLLLSYLLLSSPPLASPLLFRGGQPLHALHCSPLDFRGWRGIM